MEEKTVKISYSEYKELIAKAERVATVARMLASTSYISTDDVKRILGIDCDDVEALKERIAEQDAIIAALENPPAVEREC
jgi:putative NADH-flavin reductase